MLKIEKKWFFRTAAALACALLLLEIFLRVFALSYRLPSMLARNDGGKAGRVILCAGDSFVAGVGGRSFPEQLEEILNGRAGGHKYRVINEGVAGRNSSLTVDKLEDQILEYRPDAVILLTGANNMWNTLGGLSSARRAISADRMLMHSAVYRFWKLIMEKVKSDTERNNLFPGNSSLKNSSRRQVIPEVGSENQVYADYLYAFRHLGEKDMEISGVITQKTNAGDAQGVVDYCEHKYPAGLPYETIIPLIVNAYEALDMSDRAALMLDKARRAYPDSIIINYTLADWWERHKNIPEAASYYSVLGQKLAGMVKNPVTPMDVAWNNMYFKTILFNRLRSGDMDYIESFRRSLDGTVHEEPFYKLYAGIMPLMGGSDFAYPALAEKVSAGKANKLYYEKLCEMENTAGLRLTQELKNTYCYKCARQFPDVNICRLSVPELFAGQNRNEVPHGPAGDEDFSGLTNIQLYDRGLEFAGLWDFIRAAAVGKMLERRGIDPSKLDIYNARLAFGSRDYSKAEKLYRRALKPWNSADVYSALAQTEISLGRQSEALDSFDKSISFYPYNLSVYLDAGNFCSFQLKDLSRAEQYFLRGLKVFPLSSQLFQLYTQTLIAAGKTESVRSAMESIPSLKNNTQYKLWLEHSAAYDFKNGQAIFDTVDRQVSEDVGRAYEIAARHHVPLILASYPEKEFPSVKNLAAARSIPYIDFISLFHEKFPDRKAWVAFDNGHCNTAGYAFMAERFADAVESLVSRPAGN